MSEKMDNVTSVPIMIGHDAIIPPVGTASFDNDLLAVLRTVNYRLEPQLIVRKSHTDESGVLVIEEADLIAISIMPV